MCLISCRLDHTRLTLAGNEENQVGFVSVDSTIPPCWSSTTSWRLVECGDGSVEICSYDSKTCLTLVNEHVNLEDYAATDSHRWPIIRNAIRGVRIKSSPQGLYLGKVQGKLVARNQGNAVGDAFLRSLDPVHECQFYAGTSNKWVQLTIQVCSNGRAMVVRRDWGAVPSGTNPILLEYNRAGFRIKPANSNKYLGYNDRDQLILTTDSPVNRDIRPNAGFGSNILLGLAPWMLPASVRQNAPDSSIGHKQLFERTFDIPPSLRRPLPTGVASPLNPLQRTKMMRT